MLFNSYQFIFGFLPLTFFGFLLAGRISRLAAIAWLAAASLFFYAWWNIAYLWVLCASVCVNYAAGWAIMTLLCASRRSHARIVFAATIAANLIFLGYFKYYNFFLDVVSAGAADHDSKTFIPLGISFFTFTQIAFLVDAFQSKVEDAHPIRYLLFVTYFPHLIAGPILHHREMMPQFAESKVYRLDWEAIAVGSVMLAFGLFKKVIIADGISGYVSGPFAAAHPGFLEAWTGALAYTMQLYFDFSGYTDMALGLSRMLGVRLPLNFNSPYKAANMIDFWRRWHMTLSRFLRDYLYIPLGGNRKGPARRYTNLMITMVLGGLWHGAGWTYLAWGALHGLYLVVNHAWRHLRGAVEDRDAQPSFIGRIIGVPLTFLAVVIGWVFFRADTLADATRMVGGMSGLNGLGPVTPDAPLALVILAGLLAIVWMMPNTQQIAAKFNPGLQSVAASALFAWRPSLRWALITGVLAGIAVAGIAHRHTEFLYFQF
jgi:D-alanyl-lipoteichoic acid acyltransferase DltB (MBOAT superfamily)